MAPLTSRSLSPFSQKSFSLASNDALLPLLKHRCHYLHLQTVTYCGDILLLQLKHKCHHLDLQTVTLCRYTTSPDETQMSRLKLTDSNTLYRHIASKAGLVFTKGLSQVLVLNSILLCRAFKPKTFCEYGPKNTDVTTQTYRQ